MKYSNNIREEELKNKVAADFFDRFDCTKIIGNVDFSVTLKSQGITSFADDSLLWAESKRGNKTEIYKSFVQLILTIGQARTFDKNMPPAFLGAFDAEKIAFIPYNAVQNIFYQNDFNWNVTPSNHDTKEFQQVYKQVKTIIEASSLLFNYETDDKELHTFIKSNFVVGKASTTKIRIDKNSFIIIYNKWLETVKPTISINWDAAKRNGSIDGDFYLADLLSDQNSTLKDNLYIVLKNTHYVANRHIEDTGMFTSSSVNFSDGQKAHTQFWNKYERPPQEEYWDYIVERRDLLVPQDVRERKGSFFTPRIWVELSQKYIADVFGNDWQDEYYVWDCAAGTGNLLAGLTNKYNIWASTLDKQDVDVMRDRIKNGANLLEDHVFQFDFLNDDFSKLPQGLQNIINDPKRRGKLVVYINPPYAETMSKGVKHKAGVNQSFVNVKYISKMGNCANRELFVQFLIRIYCEIPTCMIANFSKLKNLQSPNFSDFRKTYRAKLERIFLVPANTFDNVSGQFPIGFFVWNSEKEEIFEKIMADIYQKNDYESLFVGTKNINCYDNDKSINEWIISTRNRLNEKNIGFIACLGNDFQQNNVVFIMNDKNQMASPRGSWITDKNLVEICIYFTVRKCIEATWLNDRDQFLYPNEGWKTDLEFQNDCLAYTLFNNNIQSKYGVNHWIPFTEQEVNARDKFESSFMSDFIAGKIKAETTQDLFDNSNKGVCFFAKREFSTEANVVFDTGRELWRYYHALSKSNVNASFYDIREYFQGRNDKGKMNNTSDDAQYTELIGNLRERLKLLARTISPKVYKYGFLKE
jgi:predicted RNA methylase